MEAAEFESVFPALTHRLGHRNAGLLASLMQERQIQAEKILIEDHAPVGSLFLIVSGEFRVEVSSNEKTMEIGCLRKGKWLGEVSLFSDEEISTSRVVALQDARVLELPHDEFWATLRSHPELISALTKELVDTMAERVRATDALMEREASGASAATGTGDWQSWLRSMLQGLTGTEG